MNIDRLPADGVYPRPGSGAQRGGGDLFLAVLAGSALAPFVQAVATRAGEDVYAKIRGLLTRQRADSTREPQSVAAPIVLADPGARIILRFPVTLSTSDAGALAGVRLPKTDGQAWLLVEHLAEGSTWTVRQVHQPPAGAIVLRGEP